MFSRRMPRKKPKQPGAPTSAPPKTGRHFCLRWSRMSTTDIFVRGQPILALHSSTPSCARSSDGQSRLHSTLEPSSAQCRPLAVLGGSWEPVPPVPEFLPAPFRAPSHYPTPRCSVERWGSLQLPPNQPVPSVLLCCRSGGFYRRRSRLSSISDRKLAGLDSHAGNVGSGPPQPLGTDHRQKVVECAG
jgi:hypothetical protein